MLVKINRQYVTLVQKMNNRDTRILQAFKYICLFGIISLEIKVKIVIFTDN